MDMRLFAIIAVIIPFASGQSRAKDCIPSEYKNMVAGLRGYNIISGNPVHKFVDPGFAGQIFEDKKVDKFGRVVSLSGITASGLSICHRTMSSTAFTTMNSYRNFISKESSTGVGLQIGTDTEVSVGVNLSGVTLGVKKNIPKPFERSWGDSKDFRELSQFFTKTQGMVVAVMGKCIMYEMVLQRFHMPPLTPEFKSAIEDLYEKRKQTALQKKILFKKFIQEFGTHFQLKVQMGALFMHRVMFSKNSRRQLSSKKLQKCSYVKGAKIFGIQIEKDRSGCSKDDEQKYNALNREDAKTVVITKGSQPTDIRDWSTQDFTPVPLNFKLSPIVNLMTKQHIEKAGLKTSIGEKISSLEIRKWFVPLYFDYCKSMDIECSEVKGCGINDECPMDTICKKGGNIHKCEEWSQWECTVNCGQGTQQKRTRVCNGCEGTTQQFRNQNCKPQKECYKPINCKVKYTNFNSNGGGRVQFLDRHSLDCGPSSAIRSFRLQNYRGQYRYVYVCCNTPLSCSRHHQQTAFSYRRGGNAVYLTRQQVGCQNQYISSFGIVSRDDDLSYRYNCCRASHSTTCYDHWNPPSIDGNGNTRLLDSQSVTCRRNYGLSYFRLFHTNKQWRYYFKCCMFRKPT